MHLKSCICQTGAQSAVLQTNLGGDITGAIGVSFKDATGQEVNTARLHLNQQNITRLIDGHDVNLSVLLLRTRATGPVNTVEQGVSVG
jgi:hypothetical protein